MPYTPTWNNPYLPVNSPGSAIGQSAIPTMQAQLMTGWQQPVNGIVKVNGPQSAMQIRLPPNSTSQPMIDANFDGKKGMMYVVSTDGTGTKSLEWYDFTLHAEEQPVQIDGAQFVSKQEYDQFVAKVSAALEAINNGINATDPTAGVTDSHAGSAGLHDAG